MDFLKDVQFHTILDEQEQQDETTHERWQRFLRQIDSAGADSIASICVVIPGEPVQSVQMSLWELFEIVINSK